MRTFLFLLSGLLLLFAGCKEINPRTTVRGRAINAITGEPIVGEELVIHESCGVLAGGNCGVEDVAKTITDSEGQFEMECKSRGNADVDYVCKARDFAGHYVGDLVSVGLAQAITLTKFEGNEIKLRVAPRAWVAVTLHNDNYQDETDAIDMLGGYNAETGFYTFEGVVGNPIYGNPTLPKELQWTPTMMGTFVSKYEVMRNGQTTYHQDTNWVAEGSSTLIEIHY